MREEKLKDLSALLVATKGLTFKVTTRLLIHCEHNVFVLYYYSTAVGRDKYKTNFQV